MSSHLHALPCLQGLLGRPDAVRHPPRVRGASHGRAPAQGPGGVDSAVPGAAHPARQQVSRGTRTELLNYWSWLASVYRINASKVQVHSVSTPSLVQGTN